jgi:hypothetical protein
MADEITPPLYRRDTAQHEPEIDDKGSIVDEKLAIADVGQVALESDVGDVFESPRAIDLGVDGKERPIGTVAGIDTRRADNRSIQKPTLIIPLVSSHSRMTRRYRYSPSACGSWHLACPASVPFSARFS